MGDDIRSGSVCFDFRATNVVVYGRLTTIYNSCLSLIPSRCHHTLITQITSNTYIYEMIRAFISKITWIDELVLSIMSVSIVLSSFPSSEKLVSFAHVSFPRESFCTISKGQLISEWLFDVLNFPKKTRKNVMDFCPKIEKVVESKN